MPDSIPSPCACANLALSISSELKPIASLRCSALQTPQQASQATSRMLCLFLRNDTLRAGPVNATRLGRATASRQVDGISVNRLIHPATGPRLEEMSTPPMSSGGVPPRLDHRTHGLLTRSRNPRISSASSKSLIRSLQNEFIPRSTPQLRRFTQRCLRTLARSSRFSFKHPYWEHSPKV